MKAILPTYTRHDKMPEPSPETFACVATHLPACLTGIVRGYFQSAKREPCQIAVAGEYEACMLEANINACFLGACRGGHLAIVELMIARGADSWNCGLATTCGAGHLTIVELMIAHGADFWNWGLARACDGGHLTIVELMIARGATSWDRGLAAACWKGHLTIVELMIARGANDWNLGIAWACRGGHLTIVELMIARGATSCTCGKTMVGHTPPSMANCPADV